MTTDTNGYGHYLAITSPPPDHNPADDIIAIFDPFDHRQVCRTCADLVIIPGFKYRLVTRAELPDGLDCPICGQHIQ